MIGDATPCAQAAAVMFNVATCLELLGDGRRRVADYRTTARLLMARPDGDTIDGPGVLALLESVERGQAKAEIVRASYARYDADPRVSGPDDFEAFRDAVSWVIEEAGRDG